MVRGITTETTVKADQLALNHSVASQQALTTFVVKLRPADFEQAQQLQEHVNELLRCHPTTISTLSAMPRYTTCWCAPTSGAAST
ncbi:MAG: hypothetical protein ACRYFK_15020 [Janthinobacterium lividum]